MFCLRMLGTYKANQTGLTNACKAEYESSVKRFADIQSGKAFATNAAVEQLLISLVTKPVFSLAKSKKLMAQASRVYLKCIPHHFSEMPVQELPAASTNHPIFMTLLRGNAIGEILVDMLSPSWERTLSKKCQENVTVSATQLLLALKCYQSRNGALPESLTALVPEYFSSVPFDDFDGKPLRYAREKKLIWSVGQDLIDSGGEAFDKGKKRLDLPFKIEF